MSKEKMPFSCDQCEKKKLSEFAHFKKTDSWLFRYNNLKQIHLHFGTATKNEEESTEETQWIWHETIENTKKELVNIPFFTYVDLSRSDDSELPSTEAMTIYKKLMTHPQNGQTVFYGATPSMKFFIGMLHRLTRVGDKIAVVNTKKDADRLYKKWSKSNK